MRINAVQFVHTKSNYKILTSKYEKSNRNIKISYISELTFWCNVFFTFKNDDNDTVPNEPTINKLLEMTSN